MKGTRPAYGPGARESVSPSLFGIVLFMLILSDVVMSVFQNEIMLRLGMAFVASSSLLS